MAHPYKDQAASSGHARVGKITKGYASGGRVSTGADDEMPAHNVAKKDALGKKAGGAVVGKASAPRLDRRAAGGRTKGGKTTVNVIVAPSEKPGANPAMPPPMMPPPGPSAAPPMPPPGPMPPPPGPGVAPPGGPPPAGLPIRASGGRVYEQGKKAGTQVQPSPGKNDLDDIKKQPPMLVRARGGKVYPDMEYGAGGGKGRLEKIKEYG